MWQELQTNCVYKERQTILWKGLIFWGNSTVKNTDDFSLYQNTFSGFNKIVTSVPMKQWHVVLINLICSLLIHSLGHTGCRGRVNTAQTLPFHLFLIFLPGLLATVLPQEPKVISRVVWIQTKQLVFWPISTKEREAERLHSGIFLKEVKLTLGELDTLYHGWHNIKRKCAPHLSLCPFCAEKWKAKHPYF